MPNETKQSCATAYKTMIGGQALIEGIMMLGPEKKAVVVRKPDGGLEEQVEERVLIKDKHPALGLPLLRGVFNFCSSLANGVKALMYSASFFPEDEEEPEDVEPTPPPREEPSRRREREYQEPPRRNSGGKVVNIHATTQLQVVLVKPERYENASEIADHLRDKRTVVLNLEKTQKDVARRLLDFLSGVAYAQEGKIKKVALQTYIVTPYNVDIMGDLIDELENNGLYF